MCGIVVGSNQQRLSGEVLRSIVSVLGHRGPDANGLHMDTQSSVWLGHTRLSILDVSSSANQPMTSACGRYILAYNGEVYNFKELKHRLPQKRWETGSDTEVILELIATFGPECLGWLNGMFALACYDKQAETILLARDALGIKPLFLCQAGHSWCAASELKAIQKWAEMSNLSLSLNRDSLGQFLHLGFIPHPATVYREVTKFPAGHYFEWSPAGKGKFIPFREWSSTIRSQPITNEREALDHYGSLVRDSVRRQLVSDVPIGTLLSGGIDSSLITAVAAEEKKDLQCFTVVFDEPGFDESSYAREVAQLLGVDHHLWRVNAMDFDHWLTKWIHVYDEPFGDSSAFPTLMVSQLARQNVTVALSGDGGDETFMGYGSHTWARRLSSSWAPWASRLMNLLPERLLNFRFKKARGILDGCFLAAEEVPSHIFSQEQTMFSGREVTRLMGKSCVHWTTAPQRPWFSDHPEEKQAWWDLHCYLQDDILVKVDRASMASSLEVRVPLLDNELVEFSLNLSSALKLHPHHGHKYLMRQELFRRLPASLFNRPKRGFAIPLLSWLRTDFRPLLSQYISQDIVTKWGIVSWSVAQTYVKRFLQGEDFLYHRVWLLLVLHWWLEERVANTHKNELWTPGCPQAAS